MSRLKTLGCGRAHFLAAARFDIVLDSILGDVPQSILRNVALGPWAQSFTTVRAAKYRV